MMKEESMRKKGGNNVDSCGQLCRRNNDFTLGVGSQTFPLRPFPTTSAICRRSWLFYVVKRLQCAVKGAGSQRAINPRAQQRLTSRIGAEGSCLHW